MSKPTKTEIIKALKCISTRGTKCKNEKCRYFVNTTIEEIGIEFPGCDYDQICNDAVELLEEK